DRPRPRPSLVRCETGTRRIHDRRESRSVPTVLLSRSNLCGNQGAATKPCRLQYGQSSRPAGARHEEVVHIQRGHPVGGERARTTEMHDSVFDLLTEKQLRGRNTIKWNFFGPEVLPLWVAEMDYPTASP